MLNGKENNLELLSFSSNQSVLMTHPELKGWHLLNFFVMFLELFTLISCFIQKICEISTQIQESVWFQQLQNTIASAHWKNRSIETFGIFTAVEAELYML